MNMACDFVDLDLNIDPYSYPMNPFSSNNSVVRE